MARKKTAEENQRRGNPGKRENVVVAAAVLPPMDVMPPVAISPDAAKIWVLSAPALIALKILRETDALTFSVFCESFARYTRALLVLLKEGDVQRVKTVVGGFMLRRHPMVQVLNAERDVVLRYAEKFGLTPSDRARLMTQFAGQGVIPPSAEQRFLVDSSEEDGDQLDLEDANAVSDKGPIGYLS